jgi:heme/copper-type cytochrome/quinol oxidase subunit 3
MADWSGDVVSWRTQPATGEANARVGMRIVLAAWAMMFLALLLTWAFVRAGPGPAPPSGSPVPSPSLAALSMVCLALAGAGLFLASRAAEAGRRRWIQLALLGSLACAAAAVALEVLLVLDGRRLRMSGSQGSLLLTMVAFHIWQAALGIPALAVMARRAFAGAYGAGRSMGIRLWANYWCAVLAVWCIVTFILYFA